MKFDFEHEGRLRSGGYVVDGVQGKVTLLHKVSLFGTLICPWINIWDIFPQNKCLLDNQIAYHETSPSDRQVGKGRWKYSFRVQHE